MGSCMSMSASTISQKNNNNNNNINTRSAKLTREGAGAGAAAAAAAGAPPTRNGSISQSQSQQQKPRRSIAPDTIVLIENEKAQDITVGEAHDKEKDDDGLNPQDNDILHAAAHHRRKSTHSSPRYFVFHVPSTTRSRLSQSSQTSNPTSNQTSPETETQTQVVIHHQQ